LKNGYRMELSGKNRVTCWLKIDKKEKINYGTW
jgi:hypothetical protein